MKLEKHIETASLHVTWFDAKMRDPDIAASEQVGLTMLEQAITGNDFLVVKRFIIADLIVSEVLTNLVHAGLDLRPFPAINNHLKMNRSQASAKKAFAADIIQPYLT